MKALNFSDLRNIVFEKPQERYPDLIRMFYANFTYKDGIIGYEVKKHPITQSLEDFAQVCNLPFIGQDYDKKKH